VEETTIEGAPSGSPTREYDAALPLRRSLSDLAHRAMVYESMNQQTITDIDIKSDVKYGARVREERGNAAARLFSGIEFPSHEAHQTSDDKHLSNHC